MPRHLPGAFPYLPGQSGDNKHLRAAVPLLKRVIRMLARDTTWITDSTPWNAGVPATSPAAWSWRAGLDMATAPAIPDFLRTAPASDLHPSRPAHHLGTGNLNHDPSVLPDRPDLLIIADKGYISRELDQFLADRGVRLLRPSFRNRTPHPAQHLLKPVRQLIESVNDTLKGQLDLERHGGRPNRRRHRRIAQRILALTAAIWHNRATGQPITRSLTAYDH